MELHLIRRWLTEASTIGELYDVTPDGHELDSARVPERLCYVLEDRYRPPPEAKVYGATCIPCGRYEVRITHSPKFNRDLPLLLDVPGFSGVRIHPGNTASDTEGCLLPGRVKHHESVQQSVDAFVELFAKLKAAAGPIWLTVSVEGAPICL